MNRGCNFDIKFNLNDMKRVTTKSIKSFCYTNQYIQDYLNNSGSNKYWNILRRTPGINSKGWILSINIWQNNNRYYLASKEYEHRFSIKIKYHSYEVEHIGLTWRYSVEFKLDGDVFINLRSCYCNDLHFVRMPYITDQVYFKYSGIIEKKHFDNAVIREIEKYLYPEGTFRDWQVLKTWTKKQVKEYYRYFIKNSYLNSYDQSEIEEYIKRKYNIDITCVDFDRAIEYLESHAKRYDNPVTLRVLDNSFMYSFDGDIDEAENYFWQNMDQYPEDTIFI